MALKSKCILSPIEEQDGKRISIMSRHTLNDGITPDIRITPNLYQEHNKKLAPPSKVIGSYYKHKINFKTYSEKYLEYLESISEDIIHSLILPATKQDITN
ncbi:MAG: hypothetical protein LBH96_01515 [Candidatus Peribacteria bacterium]|jgi:uncharacterized protein YeaO (DUF488 family)|nr:hypothetical protein [Candidatus Peribacteria bacterium]